MFQSAITSLEYDHFIEVCRESEQDARSLIVKYTNTDQELLHDVIDAIHHGGSWPHIPFNHSESVLQQKIRNGEYRDILSDPSKRSS